MEEGFQNYVNEVAAILADDFVALLNRAYRLGVSVCPYRDFDDDSSYAVSWLFGGALSNLDVDWNTESSCWEVNQPGRPQPTIPKDADD